MEISLSLLIAYFALFLSNHNQTDTAENILKLLPRHIKKEVASILQTINEKNIIAEYGKCSEIKKQSGLTYEQIIENGDVPYLNNITLEYFNKDVHIICNITTADQEIPHAPFYIPQKRLIIIVPGFEQNPTDDSFQSINNELIKIGETNVLALNCGYLIMTNFIRSSTYARFIGEVLGKTLAAMTTTSLDPSDIYLIGHSLGAHIVGFAAKSFNHLTGHKVGRITGLDPANSCFNDVAPDLRLNAADAPFVDIIHTDQGVYGIKIPIGHVDFYPNGGLKQPNCFLIPCSHSRSYLTYAESVAKPNAFPAVRCKDWDAFKSGQCEDVISFMGYSSDKNSRGQYFLQTGEMSPYGLGKNGLTYVQ